MSHSPNGLTQAGEKGSLKVKPIPVIAALLIVASLISSRTDSLRTGEKSKRVPHRMSSEGHVYSSETAIPAGSANAWQQVATLFPHTPGSRWVYRLSGAWYDAEAELGVEVKGQQHIPRLQLNVMVLDEAHPGVTPTAPKDVLPVLYYPHEGYLVRNTNHVYGNNERTILISTGTIGESFAPVFPLNLADKSENRGEEWQEVRIGEWGDVSQLTTLYRFGSEPEPVVVKAGTYSDCLRVETKITRTSGRGFHYTEWYTPGVGMVKSTTTDLVSGKIVEQKELAAFQLGQAEPEQKGS